MDYREEYAETLAIEDWKLHILSANSEYFIDADGEVYVMEIPEE